MILDNIFTYNQKIIFSTITAGIWIYFRTNQCYSMIPRKNIYVVCVVMLWTYVNYIEPLFLIIGLLILASYGYFGNFINNTKTINESNK